MVKPLVTQAGAEPWLGWRDGVVSRLHARRSPALCVLEQRSSPGTGAPTHTHFDTEEVIVVLAGTAEFWVDGVTERVGAHGSIVLPPGSRHGFRNAGDDELHTLAFFASPRPLVEYDESPGVVLEIGASGGRRVDGHRSYREGG